MDSDGEGLLASGAATSWQLKDAIKHVALCLTLSLYTGLGGIVFRELEYPSEIARLTHAGLVVTTSRDEFLQRVHRLHNDSDSNFAPDFETELRKYESAIQEAAQKGVLVPISEGVTPEGLARWNHLQAIFFASTVLTTIGYGNIAPVTMAGRVFCLLFALIGIPLCLTVIADLGMLAAGSLPDFTSKMENLSATIKSLISAFAALFILLVFLSIGAILFMHLEDDWSFFDSFYFCFITMTTIGFGDLVPQKPQYMLLCTLYVLVGLGLTSTIIEIVRMEYAKSWQRLQALLETLRSLGEAGGGQATVDLNALQGDLKKVLFKLGKNKGSDSWEKTVNNLVSTFNKPKAKPKIVQIIIYESSV